MPDKPPTRDASRRRSSVRRCGGLAVDFGGGIWYTTFCQFREERLQRGNDIFLARRRKCL